MRPIVLLAAGLAASPALAQPAPEHWTGRMRCEALPGRTMGPLDVAFALTIAGNRAHYERNVRDARSNALASGYWERGEGVLAPDGTLRLEGGAAAQRWSYSAVYEGRLGRGRGELQGAQFWQDGGGTLRRACAINLRRQEEQGRP